MVLSLLMGGLALASFFLTRMVLLVMSGTSAVPLSQWFFVIGKGLLFDLSTLAYVLPPLIIGDLFFPLRLRQSRFFRFICFFILAGTLFLLFFLATTEITFWMEFNTRLNFIALDYLIYTTEVLQNIWQSYPIVWIFSSIGVVAVLLSWWLTKVQIENLRSPLTGRSKIILLSVALLVPILSARFISIDDMYHQGNAFSEELSGNGLFTLAAAYRHNELDYDKFYKTIPQEKADSILKNLGVEWTDEAHKRKIDRWGNNHSNEKKPSFLLHRPTNIILISVESLSAKFVGATGSTEGLTPCLDRMAKDGFVFNRVFATGTRTVRGLEALSLSTPPIPGQSIIRRPKNEHLSSIGEMLSHQNFLAYFFYGGYGYFDNMKEFFTANDYTVIDRPTIPKNKITFENVWGVSDEDLYNHALAMLDQPSTSKKPFYAHIMTTSNHRPYTYPNGRIDIPSPGGRRGAVKYTDYAIGKFIEDAQKKSWFKKTLFVIVADHCASVAGQTELPVADYRIPLLFYGPDLIKPGRSDRMISQIDIPPTLIDALGNAGDDNFFGTEVAKQIGLPRAFISNYQSLGYYKNDQLVVLKPKQKVEGYRVNPLTLESTPIHPDPILVDEAIAYYQTASRAFKAGKLELLWK